MKPFKLRSGDYMWPEFDVRLIISIFFIIGGQEITMAQAFKKSIVRKTSRDGDYHTSAEALRILVLTENKKDRHVANIILRMNPDNGSMIHAPLYPPSMAAICSESGFFFAADEVSVVSTMEAVTRLYAPGYLKNLETMTPEALSQGKEICKIMPKLKERVGRFGR